MAEQSPLDDQPGSKPGSLQESPAVRRSFRSRMHTAVSAVVLAGTAVGLGGCGGTVYGRASFGKTLTGQELTLDFDHEDLIARRGSSSDEVELYDETGARINPKSALSISSKKTTMDGRTVIAFDPIHGCAQYALKVQKEGLGPDSRWIAKRIPLTELALFTDPYFQVPASSREAFSRCAQDIAENRRWLEQDGQTTQPAERQKVQDHQKPDNAPQLQIETTDLDQGLGREIGH